MKKLTRSPGYDQLLKRVKQTLIDGQERIEAERVRTYWETGKIIHADILEHADRADYGAGIVSDLSRDLQVDKSQLNRCIKFYKQYPKLQIVGARPQLGWAHYRKLIAVADDNQRTLLENAASRNEWTTRELAAQIKRNDAPTNDERRGTARCAPTGTTPLTPLRGEVYTYRIVTRPTVGAGEDSGLLIDLGFGIYRECDSRAVAEGDIVRSVKTDNGYRLTKIDVGAQRAVPLLFTYTGYVERVIDGDTLKVRLDLGFGVFSRHELRLRALDCPEMSTKEGQAARAFVQSYIKEAQEIIVRSSRTDKYDRYLADVFIPTEEGNDLYLNNLLLENGHAIRM